MTRTTTATYLLGLALLLLGVLHPGPALADPPAPDREGFVPEARPADMSRARIDESIPAGPLVATAYGFIWAAVLVYVGTVAARARRLDAEVAALQKRLDQKGA